MNNQAKPTIDTFNPQDKKVLFISAHPDDADFGASGTIIKWLKQGAKAAIVIATNGDKGTDDLTLTSPELAQIRHDEQLRASEVLGLDHTWFLDYPDAHLEITQELKEKLVRIIREYKPDVVFTFDPSMTYSHMLQYVNHPDHRAIGQAALDAVFPMARDFLTFPEHKTIGLEPHKVTDLFLYNFDKANYFSDITEVMDEKIKVLATHVSQLNPEEFDDIRKSNRKRGQVIGVEYAEAFVHLTLD